MDKVMGMAMDKKKKKDEKFTRDVSDELMSELMVTEEKVGVFSPFVDFVRDSDELALCFRGNASAIGVVTIYRHNHCVWNLTLKKIKRKLVGEVTLSLDHARFIKDWDTRIIPQLMEVGFVPANSNLSNATYKDLVDQKALVKRSGSQKDGFSYSIIEFKAVITEDINRTKVLIEKSYELIKEMQDNYFADETVHTEEFEIRHPRSSEVKKEKRPRNYIKMYYFENHPDAGDIDTNHNMYANFQPCVEKHVQQELFLLNHKFKDGLFIYDLEFAQPKKPGPPLKNNNKPDMFAIRFDESGKIVSIAMVEVKSTKTALAQCSGLEAHLKGMEEYINNPELMEDRKREAWRIFIQYQCLGLYGVENRYSEEELRNLENEFLNLKHEIIFVFTNGLTESTKVNKKQTVKDILKLANSEEGYDAYEGKVNYAIWSQKDWPEKGKKVKEKMKENIVHSLFAFKKQY